jgi:Chromate transport protein ChrA
LTFAKIGGFTLGSGYAMIPIIRSEVVEKKKWISDEEISDYLVLGQSLPGVIAINTATAVGKKVCGFWGALASTMGMITFPFIIIILVAKYFSKLQEYSVVQKAFDSVQALTVSMILLAVITLYKSGVRDKIQFAIFILSILGTLIFNIAPQYVIIIAGVFSLIYKKKFNMEEKNERI